MVRQGRGGRNAEEIAAAYKGVDFIGDHDLTPNLGEGVEALRPSVAAVFQEANPDIEKIAAGLAVNALWLAASGIAEGEMVVAQKPDRTYQYGIVAGGYECHAGTDLPHRRRVDWKGSFSRDDMSPALASAAKSLTTVIQLTPHAVELATLTHLTEPAEPAAQTISSEVQDQLAFQVEKQLEDFLVRNWASTSLGHEYDIYEEDGELKGQQYPSDPGRWTSWRSGRTADGSSSLSSSGAEPATPSSARSSATWASSRTSCSNPAKALKASSSRRKTTCGSAVLSPWPETSAS
ncbi:UNVERIFIED_ORG: restriction system protein [Arthrobacter globiformis]|nr:restriction system protein [Arthrobacter globiformis]